ncbi:MAG: hypothetical protein Q9218_002081 [Villophora microphyllina]
MTGATVKSDAELMWNLLPAVAIPSHSKFLTARDRNGNPMVFGIGTDHVFRVAQENPQTRARELIDLNPKLGLAETVSITAFDMIQDANDEIFLSFATVNAGQHGLYAIQPFTPSQVDFTDKDSKLKSVQSQRLDDMKIKDVLLGEPVPGKMFPSVILNYVHTVRASANLKRFAISGNSFDVLDNKGDLSLPVNSDDILCYTTGRIRQHEGVFALYKQGSKRGIIFSSYSDQFDSTLICPDGANFLTTFKNTKGETDLVVGGDGLWRFHSRDVLTRDAEGSLLCQGEFFRGIHDMHVAQCDSKVCIWAATGDDGVSYLEFSTDAVPKSLESGEQRGVPLLPEGQGGGIAGFLDRKGRNAVLASNRQHEMTYLQQSPDTREWERTPFWFPSSEHTMSMYCYMTRITISTDDGTVIPYAHIQITSTGWVDLVINGAPLSLGKTATTVKADAEGTVSIINPTTDIASYEFSIVSIHDAENERSLFAGSAVKINPMAKIDRILGNMTAERLNKATLTDGSPVFSNSSHEQLEEAAGALQAIESAKSSSATAPPTNTQTKVVAVKEAGTIGQKVIHAFWDFWHFVQNAWEKVKAWAVETYEGVKSFVIQLGQTAYRFVLDTAERIAKAASFVYQTYLKAPLEKIVDWIRNLFSWGDIVETKNHIVDFLNTTFDFIDTNVAWGADKVDSSLDGCKALIKEKLSPKNVPDSINQKRTGPQLDGKANKDAKDKMEQSDVKQSWTKYQLSHGGALKGASLVNPAGEVIVEEFQKTWNDIIKPTFESLKDTVDTIADDIMLLFKENRDFTAGDVLQKLGVDLLLGFIDAVKQVLKGLLVRLARMVRDIKGLLNKQIKVPIFSDLWVMANKIFNKDVEPPTFSVMGFIGFVLAIPITLTCKIFTGDKPRPLPKFNVLSLEKFFNGTASKDDMKSFNGMSAMIEVASASTLAVVGLVSVAGLGGLLAKFIDFQLLFGAVRLAACWPSRRDLPAWELRRLIWAADAVNVGVLFIGRKVDKGGQGEKVLATVELIVAVLNIGMHTAVNIYEMTESWADKDEERTGYQILISILGGASTIGKDVATIADDPYTKLGGLTAKQVAGKASGFFNVVNTYTNIGKGKYVAVLNSGS